MPKEMDEEGFFACDRHNKIYVYINVAFVCVCVCATKMEETMGR